MDMEGAAMKVYPETIENRWDILYRDYPEVYDRFGAFPYSPRPVDVLVSRFNLKVDVPNALPRVTRAPLILNTSSTPLLPAVIAARQVRNPVLN
jgi:hypothetical protein